MTRTVYAVQRPLGGSAEWYDVCVCLGPDMAAEVVRVLLTARDNLLRSIRIDVREQYEVEAAGPDPIRALP